jgi:hypothetical protein
MEKETIEIEFEDVQLLKEVIERYNTIYKTECELMFSYTQIHLIRIPINSSTFINSIFQIGTQIGMALMIKNYKLQFKGWFKILRKEIESNIQFSYNFNIEFTGEHGEINTVNLIKLNSSDSRIDVIKPYIKQIDYDKMAMENSFTKRAEWNQLNDYSKDGCDLSFIKTENYLLIFSTKSNIIILESIWSINSTSF